MSTWDSLNNPYSSIKKKTGTHSVEHLTRPSIYEKNSVVVSLSNQSKYSGVPNKQAGSNKQAGMNFHIMVVNHLGKISKSDACLFKE